MAGLLTVTLARAQPFEPLAHAGTLSGDFTDRASRRAALRTSSRRAGPLAPRDRRARRTAHRRRETFALETAFALSRYHRSGQILSGDWVSALVTRVGERVAAGLPDGGPRATPVRFYVVASPGVNAFATPDRTVYVTMGLLARLESEAQLAAILAHELGHVERDHALTLYLETEAYGYEQSKLRGRDRDDDPFAVNRYSRAKEEEADDFGLGLYATLGYDGAAAAGALALLGEGYLTFSEHRLAPGDLAALGQGVSPAWLLDSLVAARAPTLTDEELEARSTHPALATRIDKAGTALADVTGASFRVWTPAELARLRRQARYETVDYQLRDFDNLAALQNALGLLATDPRPDSAFLLRTIVQAGLNQAVIRGLYDDLRGALEESARGGRERNGARGARAALDELGDYPAAADALGEAQRFYHLYAEAEVDALGLLLLARAVQLEAMTPASPSARVLTDRTLELLVHEGLATTDTLRARAPEVVAAAAAAGIDLPTRLTTAAAFADLEAYNREDSRRLATAARRPVALGLERVLVVAPHYRAGALRRAGGFSEDLLTSEAGEADQRGLIAASMAAVGLPGTVLGDELGPGDAPRLAQVRVAREWLSQFASLEALRLIPHNHDRMLALAAAQEAEALVHVSEVESRIGGWNRGALVYTDLLFYALVNPVDAVASLASKRALRGHRQVVIDPVARRILHSQPLFVMSRQPGVLAKSLYYEFFDQLARQPPRR